MALKQVKTGKDYKSIMEMAKLYGVSENALFVSAAEKYCTLTDSINDMRQHIIEDGMMLKSTNVAGFEKVETHPLIPQLAKYQDTANKTLSTMIDIVVRMGTKPEERVVNFACE